MWRRLRPLTVRDKLQTRPRVACVVWFTESQKSLLITTGEARRLSPGAAVDATSQRSSPFFQIVESSELPLAHGGPFSARFSSPAQCNVDLALAAWNIERHPRSPHCMHIQHVYCRVGGIADQS